MNLTNRKKPLTELIQQARLHERNAQAELFHRFGAKMLGVCRNYIKDTQHAEEVMLDGFYKALTKIDQFHHEGAFEGWLRQIMVRECLNWLRSKKELLIEQDIDELYALGVSAEVESTWTEQALTEWVDMLTPGCKVVFMLFVVEGYKHHEIAQMLDITLGASKAQLNKARKALQIHYMESKKELYATSRN